jgi:hypothetical protein
MLRSGYVELTGVVDPTSFTNRLPELLARHEGIHVLALRSADAASAAAHLRGEGFDVDRLLALERPLAGAANEILRFRVARPDTPMAEGRVVAIEHQTPELLWRPPFCEHDNTASELRGVTIVVEDVAEASARYARFLGIAPTTRGGRTELALARGAITILGREQARDELPGLGPAEHPRIVALRVAVSDLGRTRAILDTGSVRYEDHGSEISVGSDVALGAICVFEQDQVEVDAASFDCTG